MIVPLFRALANLLGVLLLVALAVVGGAVAVFSIQGGTGTLSLANLASLLGLPELRDTVDMFLASLSEGPVDAVAALSGVGAVLVGLLLAYASLVPARERDVLIAESPRGRLAMRRRAVRETAVALVERARDVVDASAKVRPNRRRRGGSLKVAVRRSELAEAKDVRAQAREALAPVTGGAHLRVSLREKAAGGARRTS